MSLGYRIQSYYYPLKTHAVEMHKSKDKLLTSEAKSMMFQTSEKCSKGETYKICSTSEKAKKTKKHHAIEQFIECQ